MADAWDRHVSDSLQLLRFDVPPGLWIDVGTGAGFPGLAIAIASPEREVMLVEPRKRRADFLAQAADDLGAANVSVVQAKIQSVRTSPPAVISARAVAPLTDLLATAHHLAGPDTVWLLMKGRRAQSELAAALESWQGAIRIEPSLTDPDAGIVIARNVRRRAGRR